ncbi:hypothetical protein AVEN_155158-2-1, partial [Araneus ventricosus]
EVCLLARVQMNTCSEWSVLELRKITRLVGLFNLLAWNKTGTHLLPLTLSVH